MRSSTLSKINAATYSSSLCRRSVASASSISSSSALLFTRAPSDKLPGYRTFRLNIRPPEDRANQVLPELVTELIVVRVTIGMTKCRPTSRILYDFIWESLCRSSRCCSHRVGGSWCRNLPRTPSREDPLEIGTRPLCAWPRGAVQEKCVDRQ